MDVAFALNSLANVAAVAVTPTSNKVESYGAWGKEAMESFSSLASRLAITSSRPKSAVLSELYGQLNLNLETTKMSTSDDPALESRVLAQDLTKTSGNQDKESPSLSTPAAAAICLTASGNDMVAQRIQGKARAEIAVEALSQVHTF
eukprot:Em0011g315a